MNHPVRVYLTRLLCLALLFLTSVSTARADVAVLVPPQADEAVGSEVVDQAIEELTRLLKLRGFDVISAGQAGPAAEAEQQRGGFPVAYDPLHCLTPECGNEFRRMFDATFAVHLSIASRGIRPAGITVMITEDPKAFFRGTKAIEGHDVRSAVRAAFQEARSNQEDGAGPWLTLEGTPTGALVYVDNAEYGRIPFVKRHIEAGRHHIEVRADGYAVESRDIDVPARIDHIEVASVTLATLTPEADTTPRDGWFSQRSAWDWGIGGGLAALGAAHLIAGVYQRSKAGECASESVLGRCTERYGDRSGVARENVLIGVGITGLALGAAVMGFGPVARLSAHATRDTALLQLRGEF